MTAQWLEGRIAAHQVTVFDPEWDRNDRLWPALRAAADHHTDGAHTGAPDQPISHHTNAASAANDDVDGM